MTEPEEWNADELLKETLDSFSSENNNSWKYGIPQYAFY